jgi:DNA-binding transcriptional regulator YiaG
MPFLCMTLKSTVREWETRRSGKKGIEKELERWILRLT